MRKPELSFDVTWRWGQWVMGINVERIPCGRPGVGMDVYVTLRLLPLSLSVEWDSVNWAGAAERGGVRIGSWVVSEEAYAEDPGFAMTLARRSFTAEGFPNDCKLNVSEICDCGEEDGEPTTPHRHVSARMSVSP